MRKQAALFLGTAGLMLLLFSLWKAWEEYRFFSTAQRIKGEVKEVENKRYRISTVPNEDDMSRGRLKTVKEVSFSKLKVTFRDEAGVQQEKWIPSGRKNLKAGDKLDLLFDPASDRLAVHSFLNLWALPILLACCAFFFMLMAEMLEKERKK